MSKPIQQSVVEHLTVLFVGVSSGDVTSAIDTRLIETFALRAKFEPNLVFSQVAVESFKGVSNASVLEIINPDVLKITGLLFFLINSPNYHLLNDIGDVLIELLSSILHHLRLSQAMEIFNNFDPEGHYNFTTVFQLCLAELSNPKIQKLAIQLITKASLAELRKIDMSIITEIFHMYSRSETSTSVVSTIDKFFSHVLVLIKDDNTLFNEIFTKDNIQLLLAMKNSNDTIVVLRVLDLSLSMFKQITQVIVSHSAIFDNLYIYDKGRFLENDDFFYLNKLINLHSAVFSTDIDPQYLFNKFSSQVHYLFQLYASADHYSLNELIEFFTSFSYCFPQLFIELNKQYHILSESVVSPRYDHNNSNGLLLSSLNPKVIQLEVDVSSIELVNNTVQIYNNLIAEENAFLVLKQNLTVRSIERLTPTNALRLLLAMSKRYYAIIYLLNEIPVVFNNYIIYNGRVPQDKKDPEDVLIATNYALNQLKIEVIDTMIAVLTQHKEKDYTVLLNDLRSQKIKFANGDVYSTSHVQAAIETTST